MVRMPESRLGMVAAALAVLVTVGVILPLAFIGGLTVAFSSWASFPSDGPATIAGPVTARTVFTDVNNASGGDDQRGAGERYGCRLVAVRRDAEHPRAYRCVVPGHGAGDLGYRVTIRSSNACWHARGDAPPLHGCITTRVAGTAFD